MRNFGRIGLGRDPVPELEPRPSEGDSHLETSGLETQGSKECSPPGVGSVRNLLIKER